MATQNIVPRDTVSILSEMAHANAVQAARLIRIDDNATALWHLREAVKQLEMISTDESSHRLDAAPATAKTESKA